MASLKDLIVNGVARIIGKVYSSGGFVGNLEGTATKATAADNGFNSSSVTDSTPGWGYLTSGNGYANGRTWGFTNGGGIAIAEKGGQSFLQVDGDMYVHEGLDKVATLNDINGKQATLVSGTNIKTINSTSILGSGNISIATNTAGSTNYTSKLYFIGATSQTTSTTTYSDSGVFMESGWINVNQSNGGVILQKNGVETARFRSKDGTISTPALKTYSDKHTNFYGSLNILCNNMIRMYHENISGGDAYLSLSENGIYLDTQDFAVDSNSLRYKNMLHVDSDGTVCFGKYDSFFCLGSCATSMYSSDAIHLNANYFNSSIYLDSGINISTSTKASSICVNSRGSVHIDAGPDSSVKFQNGRVQINEYGSIEIRDYSNRCCTTAEITSSGVVSACEVRARYCMYSNGYRVLTSANFKFNSSTGTLDITI